jgi:hypothetical protein
MNKRPIILAGPFVLSDRTIETDRRVISAPRPGTL